MEHIGRNTAFPQERTVVATHTKLHCNLADSSSFFSKIKGQDCPFSHCPSTPEQSTGLTSYPLQVDCPFRRTSTAIKGTLQFLCQIPSGSTLGGKNIVPDPFTAMRCSNSQHPFTPPPKKKRQFSYQVEIVYMAHVCPCSQQDKLRKTKVSYS